MTNRLSLALAGAAGRMGEEVVAAICSRDDCALTQALVSSNSRKAGEQLSYPHFADLQYTTKLDPKLASKVLIVFALPEASMQYLAQAQSIGLPVVMCSTGVSSAQLKAIAAASTDVPLLLAPNTSMGVVWLARIAAELARGLPNADVEIVESHHRDKLDSPSGTALRLGRAIAEARNTNLDAVGVMQRNGHNRKREPGSIGFASLRLGKVVGDHSICFGMDGETIELTHRAISRQTFALGALNLAHWLAEQPVGMYRVEDAIEA